LLLIQKGGEIVMMSIKKTGSTNQLNIAIPKEAFKPEARTFWYGFMFAVGCIAILNIANHN